MLHQLIKRPIIEQCNAATLEECVKDLENYKQSDEYKKEVRRSRGEDDESVSKQLRSLNKQMAKAQRLREKTPWKDYWKITAEDKHLWDSYEFGDLHKKRDDLLKCKKSKHEA